MEEYLSAFFDDFEDTFSLSVSDDATYAEELQLQEVLAASSYISSPEISSSSHRASTSSPRISCEICTEDMEKSEMFQVQGCPHSFCFDCISKHVEYKLQDQIIHISCPDQDCGNIIEPGSLRSVVSQDVVDGWEEAIAESTILASEKIHCPYRECSAVLVNDSNEGIMITETECPNCHRLFCVKCKVPWHQGFDCREFKRLDRNVKEKKKLRSLARENNWMKCPNCKVFVEKTEGCIHITCRCKFEFCYICGLSWNENHWNTCQE